MSLTNVSVNARGTSIFTIIYGGIILGKIFGLLDWSWFWILSPFIFILSCFVLAFVGAYVIPAVYHLITKYYRKLVNK